MNAVGKMLLLLVFGTALYSCAGSKASKTPPFTVLVQYSDGTAVDSSIVDSIGISTFPQLNVERIKGAGARYSVRGLSADQRYRIDVQYGVAGTLLTRDQFYMDDEFLTLKIPAERKKDLEVIGTRPTGTGTSGGTVVPTKQ